VTCVVTSSASCVTGNPATSNPVTMSVTTIPVSMSLTNVNITGVQCFNASQTITVAGNGTSFTVQSGGRATLIAGKNIRFLPGARVFAGGYLRGYIATNGIYCLPTGNAKVTQEEEATNGMPEVTSLQVRIYPNPTDGEFMVDLAGVEPGKKARISIHSMTGALVYLCDLEGAGKYLLSLASRTPGVYFIRIVSGDQCQTSKIIRR